MDDFNTNPTPPPQSPQPPNPTPPATPPTPTQEQDLQAPPRKIGKFKASIELTKQSFALLSEDKEVLLFPLLSFFTSILAFIALIVISIVVFDVKEVLLSEDGSESEAAMSAAWYVYIFFTYVVSVFITTYFQAGLVTIVYARINKENKSFSDGIHNANEHIGKIFIWSLLSATVGTILNIISDKSKWLGKIVASLLGAVWSIVTLFITPVLVLEDLSLGNSIKRSGSIFKSTWGETLIMNFTVGFIFIFAIFGTIGVASALAFLTQQVVLFAILGIIAIFFLILLSSTLDSVFKVVLYHYARTGTIPSGFDRDLLLGAVKKKD